MKFCAIRRNGMGKLKVGLCEEGLEVVLDQRIERRQRGTAPAVYGPTVRRRGRRRWVWSKA